MKKRGKSFVGKVCGDPRQIKAAKRQAYGEAWADGMARARNLVSRLLPEEQETFSQRLRAAIKALAESKGGLNEWAVIAGTILQIEALGRIGVVKTGCDELVAQARETVESTMDRHKATGSNVLRPVEIDVLMDLADNWDLILGAVTVGELNRSSEIAIRKRANALATGRQQPMLEAA